MDEIYSLFFCFCICASRGPTIIDNMIFFWKSLFFSASENQNFLIRLNDSRLQSVTVFAFFSGFSVYTEHIDLNLLFSQKERISLFPLKIHSKYHAHSRGRRLGTQRYSFYNFSKINTCRKNKKIY